MPDLFFYRDPKAVEKEENQRAENEQVMKSEPDLPAPPQRKSERTGLLTVSLPLSCDRGLVHQHRDH